MQFARQTDECGKAAVAVRQHFGGLKAVARPDPIPNSAVKRSLADGSGCLASARVGSRQSFNKKPEFFYPAFLLSGAGAGEMPLSLGRFQPQGLKLGERILLNR